MENTTLGIMQKILPLLLAAVLGGCGADGETVVKHSRHIPREHIKFGTPMSAVLEKEKLYDSITDPEVIKAMRECGVSVIETRLVWSELEREKGVLDYSRLERDMALIEKNGFKVGVFNWFQHPPKWSDLTRARCLAHGVDSTIISLWDPRYLAEYDRLLKDLAQKYGSRISFLYVGVHGDYGEVMYPAGCKHYKFSPPHGHSGLWCGDSLARADFQNRMRAKYKTVEALNAAWKTNFNSFDDDLMPKLPLEANNINMRADFALWYSKSLIDFTDKICAIARRHFPDTKMALPVGCLYESRSGEGMNKSQTAKLAAKYNMTARWTGVAHTKEFARTNVSTKRLSAAARFYGAKFGVEAAAGIAGTKVPAAIYESLANGSSMFHNDPASILKELPQYLACDKYLKCLPRRCDKGVYYPYLAEITRSIDIRDFYAEFAKVRGHCDYELTDDFMIGDGFLKTVKELILVKNCPIPQKTADILAKWQSEGGSVYHIKNYPPVILETGAPAPLGTPVESFDFFGKSDGCFYTDHGDVVSKFNPATGGIEFIKK